MRMHGLWATAALLMAMPAIADDKPPEPPPLAATELQFARDAWHSTLALVRLGDLATRLGKRVEVQRFGRMVTDDLGRARLDLEQVLDALHVERPDALDERTQATFDKLAKLTGEAFDKAYLDTTMQLQNAAIVRFDAEEAGGNVAALKDFAATYGPVLADHGRAAADLRKGFAKPREKFER